MSSKSEFLVLKTLVEDGSWMDSSEIVEDSGLTIKKSTSALRSLIKFKYVKRNRSVKDSRKWIYKAINMPVTLHKLLLEEKLKC